LPRERADKDEVVRPLAALLRQRSRRVWVDEGEIKCGDSLHQKIDDGLARSRFGLVVLSPAFFGKRWPRVELDLLAASALDLIPELVNQKYRKGDYE